jgi:hypothetical protein
MFEPRAKASCVLLLENALLCFVVEEQERSSGFALQVRLMIYFHVFGRS